MEGAGERVAGRYRSRRMACARHHAQHVVGEWSRLDVEVPAVAELRELLRRLPAAPE